MEKTFQEYHNKINSTVVKMIPNNWERVCLYGEASHLHQVYFYVVLKDETIINGSIIYSKYDFISYEEQRQYIQQVRKYLIELKVIRRLGRV